MGHSEQFAAMGFLEPFWILDVDTCEAVIRDAAACVSDVSWYKGLHEFDSACSRVAQMPQLIEVVGDLIGDDIMVWSARLIHQAHGVRHRWHADVESMTWPTVNVWIGLRNVATNSFLSLCEGSNRLGVAPQDLEPPMDLLDDAEVLSAAVGRDPMIQRRDLPMGVGEAVVFDGRTWHSSQTPGPDPRAALLLQYSPSNAVPRILSGTPEISLWSEMKPPCLVVAGSRSSVNPANVVIERLRRAPGPIRTLSRRTRRKVAAARRRMISR